MTVPVVAGQIARAGATANATSKTGKIVDFTTKYKNHRLNPPPSKNTVDKALDGISTVPNLKPKEETAKQLPNEDTVQNTTPNVSVKGTGKSLFANLPHPKTGIAIVLTLIVFILFAIQPVELEDGTKITRLKLFWKSLLGRAELEGYSDGTSQVANTGWTKLQEIVNSTSKQAYQTGRTTGETIRSGLDGVNGAFDTSYDFGNKIGNVIGGWLN